MRLKLVPDHENLCSCILSCDARECKPSHQPEPCETEVIQKVVRLQNYSPRNLPTGYMFCSGVYQGSYRNRCREGYYRLCDGGEADIDQS